MKKVLIILLFIIIFVLSITKPTKKSFKNFLTDKLNFPVSEDAFTNVFANIFAKQSIKSGAIDKYIKYDNYIIFSVVEIDKVTYIGILNNWYEKRF